MTTSGKAAFRLGAVPRRWWIILGVCAILLLAGALFLNALFARGAEIGAQRRQAEAARLAADSRSLAEAFRALRLSVSFADGTKRDVAGATSTMAWFTLDDGGSGRAVVVARSQQGNYFATSFLRQPDGVMKPSGDYRPMTVPEVTALYVKQVPGLDPQVLLDAANRSSSSPVAPAAGAPGTAGAKR